MISCLAHIAMLINAVLAHPCRTRRVVHGRDGVNFRPGQELVKSHDCRGCDVLVLGEAIAAQGRFYTFITSFRSHEHSSIACT